MPTVLTLPAPSTSPTQAADVTLSTSPEERRVNKVLRRTRREVHKLRHSAPQTIPDVLSFKEKMAFFLNGSGGNTTTTTVITDGSGNCSYGAAAAGNSGNSGNSGNNNTNSNHMNNSNLNQ